MSITSIIIAWPIYLLLEAAIRYIGFVRTTDPFQRTDNKPIHLSLFSVASPGWGITEFLKSRICDAEGRKKFIIANNTDNIIVSAIFLSLPVAIHLQGLNVPEIGIGLLFWRYFSRSLEISRAFVEDILESNKKSGLDQDERIKLALKSYAEIYIYAAALYSVLSPCLASLETATLGALYVGTLTNISFVTDQIEFKHIVFVQVFATLSLVVLSIAGYLSNSENSN
jgi:hypothetical protein